MQNNINADTLVAAPFLLGLTVSPDAAIGALFGSMFFWAMNPSLEVGNKAVLLLASFGAGYSLALPWGPGGWEMFAGVFGSSLVHTALEAFQGTIRAGGAMPVWLKELISILPWKNRND